MARLWLFTTFWSNANISNNSAAHACHIQSSLRDILVTDRSPDLKTWRDRCIYILNRTHQKYLWLSCYFMDTNIRTTSYLCVLNLSASFPALRLSRIPFAGDTKTVNNAPPLFITPRMSAWRHSGERTFYDNWKEVKSVAFLSSGEIVFLLLVTELLWRVTQRPWWRKENTARCQ